MRGKIAFVLGAAVGYVLGSRAGRERYEQIKRGAKTLWNTEPVQQGVGVVQGAVGDGLNTLKNAAMQSGKDVLSTLVQNNSSSSTRTGSGSGSASSGSTGSGSSGAGSKSGSQKSAAKSSGSRSSRSSTTSQKTSQAGDAES